MTVKEFFELDDEEEMLKLSAIKKSLKGRPRIGNYKTKPLLKYPFWKMLQAKKYYDEGRMDYLCSMTLGIGISELFKRPYQDFMYFIKWIEEQFEQITILERSLSEGSDPEEQMKLEAAGMSEMSKFEELNIIDELASGDMTKWERINNFTYEQIYVKMLRNKTKSDIQKRYQRQNTKTK